MDEKLGSSIIIICLFFIFIFAYFSTSNTQVNSVIEGIHITTIN